MGTATLENTELQAGQKGHIREWEGPTGVKFRDVCEDSGIYYHDTTPRQVIDWIESAYRSGARVRLFLGDGETGRDWMEEWSVTGTIGRSTGIYKLPLLISSSRSYGGVAISTDAVVKLLINGREVYKHPKYHLPNLELVEDSCGAGDEYKASVKANGEVHARFRKVESAKRWIAFMKGERMSK